MVDHHSHSISLYVIKPGHQAIESVHSSNVFHKIVENLARNRFVFVVFDENGFDALKGI
ncbi:uncharacterized protein PHALS_10712 [Plasmopara halstedii]|uniref:Uncharacterized protein n=1 Tax=Plasmopara halstedii TaxID=4781 RepID=A0A0P1AH11_PLAHL|nr:uncharacterized protein PHALS_10712 [Plasmopara halstedii]CEG40518.1 hypothetical protein PHALS_10712 [Plasmopara halstedii]|eukprot:XP_024576887.1 hypothetical protein PHALS_10712 [Plasmopara halstedii]